MEINKMFNKADNFIIQQQWTSVIGYLLLNQRERKNIYIYLSFFLFFKYMYVHKDTHIYTHTHARTRIIQKHIKETNLHRMAEEATIKPWPGVLCPIV